MDALSLSHLTYRCATVTVNFHRLDHPPFPCKGRLLPRVIRTQVPANSYPRVHPEPAGGHHIAVVHISTRKVFIHEASNHYWNTPHRFRHHWIRYGRTLLQASEKRCRSWTGSDLPPDAGHPPDLPNPEHHRAGRRPRPGRRWHEVSIKRVTQFNQLLPYRKTERTPAHSRHGNHLR